MLELRQRLRDVRQERIVGPSIRSHVGKLEAREVGEIHALQEREGLVWGQEPGGPGIPFRAILDVI